MPRRTTRSDLHPGDLRLLHDIAVLQRVLEPPRASARERLERIVSPELVRAVQCSVAAPFARAA